MGQKIKIRKTILGLIQLQMTRMAFKLTLAGPGVGRWGVGCGVDGGILSAHLNEQLQVLYGSERYL